MKAVPPTIQLTYDERLEIAKRAYVPYGKEPTIARYWRGLLAARGIVPTARAIPVTVPTQRAGEYRIEWHPRALGPKAIAQGVEFRAHMEERDAKYTARLHRQGRETPPDHWR